MIYEHIRLLPTTLKNSIPHHSFLPNRLFPVLKKQSSKLQKYGLWYLVTFYDFLTILYLILSLFIIRLSMPKVDWLFFSVTIAFILGFFMMRRRFYKCLKTLKQYKK